MKLAAKERARPLILVAEDYEDTLEIVSEVLSLEGFDVATATTGIEAVEKAQRLLPDLVIMDLSLPELDGWEATRRLKSHPERKEVRIIALTAHALGVHADKAREAGCDAFVTKPCLPDELAKEVRRVLGIA